MLSVLLAYNLPRCRLKIVFQPHRCGAKRPIFFVIDAKQIACDPIARREPAPNAACFELKQLSGARHPIKAARYATGRLRTEMMPVAA
jgi:hypothetical protein